MNNSLCKMLPLPLQVLADFRAGLFNTLVATCIGEEGLDIPQVRLCSFLCTLSYLGNCRRRNRFCKRACRPRL